LASVTNWRTPATDYPRTHLRDVSISTITYDGFHECFGVRGQRVFYADHIPVTILKIRDKVWMVDDPPHWWNIQDQSQTFHGHVLCAGLGLGLIVHALHARPEVTKITVVEQERSVIDLVVPWLPQEKLEIVHDDFWHHAKERDVQPDGVFFDLFVGNGLELIGHALRVFILLNERFGDVPIHIFGFPNRMFEQLRQSVQRVS
jgi:hypothetical protein